MCFPRQIWREAEFELTGRRFEVKDVIDIAPLNVFRPEIHLRSTMTRPASGHRPNTFNSDSHGEFRQIHCTLFGNPDACQRQANFEDNAFIGCTLREYDSFLPRPLHGHPIALTRTPHFYSGTTQGVLRGWQRFPSAPVRRFMEIGGRTAGASHKRNVDGKLPGSTSLGIHPDRQPPSREWSIVMFFDRHHAQIQRVTVVGRGNRGHRIDGSKCDAFPILSVTIERDCPRSSMTDNVRLLSSMHSDERERKCRKKSPEYGRSVHGSPQVVWVVLFDGSWYDLLSSMELRAGKLFVKAARSLLRLLKSLRA